MRWAVLLIILACPASASQDDWPALFNVTGVAQDDVLNIRAEPDAASEIIGTLAPNAANIEVLWPDEKYNWGQVNTGEGAGWISLRYLARQDGQWAGRVPPIVRCFGTEPFWSIDREGEFLLSAGLERATTAYRVSRTLTAAGRYDPHVIQAEGPDATLWLRFGRAECSDGMSERLYGIEADAIIDGVNGPEMLSGCCSLVAN